MLAPSYDLATLNRWREALTAQRGLLIALVVSFIGYFGPSRLPLGPAHEVPATALDRAMPLLPWTVLGYVLLYPFLVATILYLTLRPRALRPIASALIASNLIAGVIFVLYRTTVPRPLLLPDSWDAELLLLLWRLDPPFNALPSLHTTYAIVLAWGFIKLRSRWVRPVLYSAAIIIITTLTTYQHRVLDLIGGAILASMICYFFYRRLGPRDDQQYW